jgi:hypothetical protein
VRQQQGVTPSGSGHEPTASAGKPSSQSRVPNADKLITAGMLADRLRPIVLGGESSCLDGTPMIPLHRTTVSAIYQHLERMADLDGETTLFALECALRQADERHAEQQASIKAKLLKRGEQVSA